jgi:N-acetylglucosaminyldiphosphoundecaprenol N-acetyl-beta-D-mannosaminyltransferase
VVPEVNKRLSLQLEKRTIPPRANILGVGVSAIDMAQALDQMAGWIDRRTLAYVVVCPVYTVMQCQKDPDLRSIVNRAGMVTPDGMPIVFLSRRRGHPRVSRVYGPDLMLAFSEMAAERGYTNFYYGGADGVPEALVNHLTRRYPELRVVGAYSPPFRELTAEEEDAVVEMINLAAPDVVWVGLGSPKQDFWMARHRERLNAPVLVGVGAAFDFLTGRVPQAPRWMQRSGLEWLFRLAIEPRRLWRRYLINNPLFIAQAILQQTGLRHWSLDE